VLNEQDWQGLALGLFQGLEEVHAEGIIHRDIKPSNILISNTGPKLIDFVIAQGSDATSLTSTGLVAGSPAWLAPEQIHGETLTSAADIFSAGSVLKFAATGNSPWGDSTSTTTPIIFNKILTKDPDFTGLTSYQKTFLSKLMHKNAKQRITARQANIEIKNQMNEISQESIIEKKQIKEKRLKELEYIEIQEKKRKIRNQKNEKLLLDLSRSIKKIFVKNYKIISVSFAVVAGGLLFLNFGINQVSSVYSNLTASKIVSTPTPVPTPAIVKKLELSTNVTATPMPVVTNSPESDPSPIDLLEDSDSKLNSSKEQSKSKLEWYTKICRSFNNGGEQCWDRKLTNNDAKISRFHTTGLTQSGPLEFEMRVMPCMSLAFRYSGIIQYSKSNSLVQSGSVAYEFQVLNVSAFWEQHSRGDCQLPDGNVGKLLQLPGLEGFRSRYIDLQEFDTVVHIISGAGRDFVVIDNYS
jgi:serine/threonine protein kinase